MNHVPFERVLDANLDFDGPLRPAWWVLIAGTVLVVVRLARPFWSRKAAVARRPSLRTVA